MQLIQNRVSHKIDFKTQWLRNGHADSVGVKSKVTLSESGFQLHDSKQKSN